MSPAPVGKECTCIGVHVRPRQMLADVHEQGPSRTVILKAAHHYKTLSGHITHCHNQPLSVNLCASIGEVAVKTYTRSACHKEEPQESPSWGTPQQNQKRLYKKTRLMPSWVEKINKNTQQQQHCHKPTQLHDVTYPFLALKKNIDPVNNCQLSSQSTGRIANHGGVPLRSKPRPKFLQLQPRQTSSIVLNVVHFTAIA